MLHHGCGVCIGTVTVSLLNHFPMQGRLLSGMGPEGGGALTGGLKVEMWLISWFILNMAMAC